MIKKKKVFFKFSGDSFSFIIMFFKKSLCALEDVTSASEGAVQRPKEKSLSHRLAF